MSRLTNHNVHIIHSAFQYCVHYAERKADHSVFYRTSITGHLAAVFHSNHDVQFRSFHKISIPLHNKISGLEVVDRKDIIQLF